jgi:hypothetical protein
MQYIFSRERILHSSLWLSAFLVLLFPSLASAYQAAPVAITKAPTFITEKSVQMNASANGNEMPDTYVWFEWGISGREGTTYETQHIQFGGWWGGGNQLADTNAKLSGLAPSTQYFYRIVAENGRGKDYGSYVYFTTKPLVMNAVPFPAAQTQSATFVDEGRATIRGYISPQGANDTRYWFEWGVSREFENMTQSTGKSGDAGQVEVALNNLSPGTVYFYRVVAESTGGRSTGATMVFMTKGNPPPPPEAPRAQNIPEPTSAGGDTSRNVTNSGATSNASSNGLPSASNRPGDIFGALFGRKNNSSAPVQSTDQNTENNTSTQSQANQQTASVGSTNPFSALWGAISGGTKTAIVVEKIGPAKITTHTPVEYKITLKYSGPSATDATVKVTIPSTVIYIGDNTNNELLLSADGGAERTYILPLGSVKSGTLRSFSILGMTTGDATAFPDARARIEYTDSGGTHVVSSGDAKATAKSQTAASGASSDGILPSSLFGWIFYIALVIGAIFGFRKAKEYYLKKREELEKDDNTDRSDNTGYETDQKMLERLIAEKRAA